MYHCQRIEKVIMDSVVCLQHDARRVQTSKEMAVLHLGEKSFEGVIGSDEYIERL